MVDVRVDRNSQLRPIYEEVGLLRQSVVLSRLRRLEDHFGTMDDALIHFHGAFLPEINRSFAKERSPLPVLEDYFEPQAAGRIRDALLKLHQSFEDPQSLFPLLIDLARPFMEADVAHDLRHLNGRLLQAYEALIWRSFDALRSANELHRLRVPDCHVAVGCAQEALIQLMAIRKDPATVDRLRANELFRMWKRLATAIAWHEEHAPEHGNSLKVQQGQLASSLSELGFNVEDRGDTKKLTANERLCAWQQLVNLCDVDRRVFGDYPTLRYQEVYGLRDAVAHSRPSTWDAYAAADGGRFRRICSLDDPPIPANPHSLWVWKEFFAELGRLRNSIPSYHKFCIVMQVGGWAEGGVWGNRPRTSP